MNTYQEIWNSMLSLLKEKIGDKSFNEVFKDCTKVHKYENDYIFVIVPNVVIKFRIEAFYVNTIKELVPYVTEKKIGFKFIKEEDIKDEIKPKMTSPDEIKPFGRTLSTLYRFDNFEVGASNRYAFVTSMKVAENGVTYCNPLYIFGDVGLGKTHLMTSIGNFALDNNINTNVVYTSSQKFAEDYFLATNTKNSKDKIIAFYNKYNQADILLVDDIQFLEGKTGSQEEFFKVFEHLYTSQKQIVITSDRPASSLKNIMERLKSRFTMGICVDIKQPDKQLLINILKNKLKFLIDDVNDVNEEVLNILADCFPSNIRELEGALRTFINYCTCMNVPFNKENLFLSLESIIPKQVQNIDSNKQVINDAKAFICSYYKISENDLNSSSRKQQVAYARQMLMYVLRNHFNIQLQVIGDNLGDRDHATVAHGVDKIASMIKSNELIKNDYEIIIKNLKK